MGAIAGYVSEIERIQAAVNLLFGVSVSGHLRDVPRLSGLRELYVLLSGDYELTGRFFPERVTLANVNTTTLDSVVKNALNVVMLESFYAKPQWWKPIVYEEDFPNMNAVTWVTGAGFGDLPTVAEWAAYQEMTWSDNEETSSFLKKGGFVGITLEMIDRDQVHAVRQIPRKLGFAAWRTLSSLVSALFTQGSNLGPLLSDGKRLFHADHGNLGTSALSVSSWDAACRAMWKQAELGSSKRLGVRPSYVLVPVELENTALTIFSSPYLPGTANNDVNVRVMSADHVITVPEFTDANDWAAVAAPVDLQGVCLGYRFGREPELFTADSPQGGSMFTNDEMRIKARFVVTAGIGDYRALYKQKVA